MSRYNRCKECYNMKCVFVTGERDDFDSSECADFKPMTNADRIREWSDEEIAEFTVGVADGVFELFTGAKMPNEKRIEMKTAWLDWLKQEAEDEKDVL